MCTSQKVLGAVIVVFALVPDGFILQYCVIKIECLCSLYIFNYIKINPNEMFTGEFRFLLYIHCAQPSIFLKISSTILLNFSHFMFYPLLMYVCGRMKVKIVVFFLYLIVK